MAIKEEKELECAFILFYFFCSKNFPGEHPSTPSSKYLFFLPFFFCFLFFNRKLFN